MPVTTELQAMRLTELQARYAEVIGEPTRCPNKTWLIRKITEELAAKDAEAEIAAEQGAPLAIEGDAPAETKLTKLTIPELQAKYLEVVGRATGSSSKSYLVWKIQQAMKGKVPVGPRDSRQVEGDFKVLPLRMESEMVKRLDEARERLGLASRMELFRVALSAYLKTAGETDVAALLAPEA
ncbi:MAG: ribbon-helix-helix protein, CopG family [Dehalococcoidia bacterium]